MKNRLFFALLVILSTGCARQTSPTRFPVAASVAAEKVNIASDSIPIYLGGYGSSMVYNPADSCFYLLTDRGPNVDGITSESKVFPIPDYAPTIGRFRLQGDSLLLVEKITLKDSGGRNFTGLPNTDGDGVTGETAYDLTGNILSSPSRGIDPEGLAIAPDGTFWVSDEYAPFILQFDRHGILLRELSPSKGLPAYYSKRRPNRGMEGLTISDDGKKLYGIMQSPLYLPDQSTKDASVNNRIVEIDLLTGSTREFIYQMESPKNVVSEICFADSSALLVLERDANFPKNGKGFKRVYKVNPERATDVSGKIAEQLSTPEMNSAGITPVTKELFIDILTAVPGYRHDKPEGIALMGDSVLCVVNDDDFGINATTNGRYIPKLDSEEQLDRNVVYFIKMNGTER